MLRAAALVCVEEIDEPIGKESGIIFGFYSFLVMGNALRGAHVSGVDFALYYVEDRDITCRFARHRRNHTIFWLQKPTHDV